MPMRFHAARQVHRRAPEIVDELLAADDAGDHRSGIDADAERKPLAAECPARNRVAHVEGKLDQSQRVVGSLARHASGDHVAVADRLDLFEAVLLDEIVESGEDLVEQVDQAQRNHRRSHRGEPDNIGEQDAGGFIMRGDGARSTLSASEISFGRMLRISVSDRS